MSRRNQAMPGRILLGMALFLLLPASLALGAGETDPYATAPQTMTVAECGRCHPGQFGSLRDHGGRHRFDCRDCHEAFHAYNPRKGNYDELMPRCGTCHSLPHGPTKTDCLACHEDPHAPRTKLAMKELAGSCPECHPGPAEQLRDFPSAHSRQACQACHSQRHGRIPGCSECHQPHYQEQAEVDCLACHPVHKPLEVAFTANTAAITCSACHEQVFANWSKTQSRHGQVNCTLCHTRHGYVPECTDCHKAPHPPKMLARFKSCLGCHMDPHNLPVK